MSLGALYGLLMGQQGADKMAANTEALRKQAEEEKRYQAEQAYKQDALKRSHPTLQEESQQIESVDQSSPSALSNLLMLKGRDNADQIAAEISLRNSQRGVYDANADQTRAETDWIGPKAEADINLSNAQANKALHPQKDLAKIPADKVIALADGSVLPQLLQDLKNDLKNPKYSSRLGPVAGRLTGIDPWDEDKQYIDAKFSKVQQLVGKFIEGGVLRAEDGPKYDKILGNAQKNPAGSLRVLDSLEQDLIGKYNAHVKYLGAAGYDTSGIPVLGQKQQQETPTRKAPRSGAPQPKVASSGAPSKRSIDPYLSASDDAIQAALAKRGIK